MKHLHDKVNIVPVIAKADTLTPSELRKLKERVRETSLSATLSLRRCYWNFNWSILVQLLNIFPTMPTILLYSQLVLLFISCIYNHRRPPDFIHPIYSSLFSCIAQYFTNHLLHVFLKSFLSPFSISLHPYYNQFIQCYTNYCSVLLTGIGSDREASHSDLSVPRMWLWWRWGIQKARCQTQGKHIF